MELLRQLRLRGCVTPIVFYSAFGDVETVSDAFREGAFQFVAKDSASRQLLDAVQEALRYDAVEQRIRARVEGYHRRMGLLSDGERAVAEGLAADKSYKQITAAQRVSYKTVEARRARAFKKLSVESIVQLVRQSMEFGQIATPCAELAATDFAGSARNGSPASNGLQPWADYRRTAFAGMVRSRRRPPISARAE